MTQVNLPAILNDAPTRADVKRMNGVMYVSVAFKIAKKIYIRCRLAEAQNWKCCWCGIECTELPNKKHSVTIEHVIPRSEGGDDAWENYAMACAACNSKRGVISVEDMLAKKFPASRASRPWARRKTKSVEKYIKKALNWNANGWTYSNGSPMCPKEWLSTLRLNKNHLKKVEAVVFGETA